MLGEIGEAVGAVLFVVFLSVFVGAALFVPNIPKFVGMIKEEEKK